MTPAAPHRPRVAVVGAGVTGLAAALRARELRPDAELLVLEAGGRPGGVLETVRRDGWLVERSADNFLTRLPYATDFCRKLGVEDELLGTDARRRRALVVRDGRVCPLPEGFMLMAPGALGPVLRSPALSWRGKARLCGEALVPRARRAPGQDESVADFARRRVGREAFERLVQPLLAGIYTGDPEKLSMAATMPQFLQQEQEHGSLTRAARRERRARAAGRASGARYDLFVAPREGMQRIIAAAAERLPPGALRTGAQVRCVRRGDHAWSLELAGGEAIGNLDAVILTTPAYVAADQLRGVDPRLTDQLRSIEYAGASVVCFGFREDQVPAAPEAFGIVVPAVEGRRVIAVSFASFKFPGRAPAGRVLVRVFVGGALRPDLAELGDEPLTRLALEELASLVGVRGAPELVEIARWPRRMPQYHVGHLDLVASIETLTQAHPGLELAGAAYRGVGVPQCIHSGEAAAERAAARLARQSAGVASPEEVRRES